MKIFILFLLWSKYIHSNQKGIIRFKQNLVVIYKPRGRILFPKMAVLVQKWYCFHIWLLWGMWHPSSFPLNVFGVLSRLIGIHFHHCKNEIQIFKFWPFRLHRGSEVTVGSEDPLQLF